MKIVYDFVDDFRSRYRRSLNTFPYRTYRVVGGAGVILVFLLSTGASLLYHMRIPGISFTTRLTLTLIPSSIITIASAVIVLIYPNYKMSTEKNRVEEGLLYTVSYMTILANCGFSVDRIFTRVTAIEQNSSIRRLMTSFLTDIGLFGYDIEQGLDRLKQRSPSGSFSELLTSISNASWTSGDLKELMGYHFEVLDKKRKNDTEKMIDSLTILSEIYVAMMVIAPIMLIIMFTLLSVLMRGMNSMSTISILNSITFVLLPFVAAGFIVILDTMRGAD